MQDQEKMIDNNDIRWAVKRRLIFLETRLYWEGQINRSDLISRFKISVPQASADIAQYSELAPSNLSYDTTRKSYIAADDFKPIFFRPSAEQYLSQLQALKDEVLDSESTIIGYTPDYGALSIPRRSIDPDVLQKILIAVRERKAIEICYESYSQAEISWRWISPHAFASDGNRWHVRAFCHTHQNFRDFVLGRISKSRKLKPFEIDGKQDTDWHEFMQVRLRVNKTLPSTKQQIVERDYMMKNGVLELSVRRSLLYYLYFNLGFNNPRDDDLLVLEDSEQIKTIIFGEQAINTHPPA